jgi:tubulin monoglycylase TTLL3/8
MLDDNFKVYLIEANTNPCLETTCPILQKVISEVVDTGLRLGLDPLFPPPNYQKRMSQQIPVTPYELCYDSRLDESEMDAIYGKYEAENEQEFDEDLLKEEELDEVYD